ARDDVRYLQQASARFGARFARPGAGPAAMLHRRRFAVPGRVLASASPGAGGCGAFGMVHLAASALESAGALAGEPLLRARPHVLGVRLVGELASGATGLDVLAVLARRAEGRAQDGWIEYHGQGVAALAMCDRIAMAAHGHARLGADASVFPVDDVVRAYLRMRGRDSQWRRLEGGDEGFDIELELDLADVTVASGVPPGLGLGRVRVGPLAEDAELRRLARALAGQQVHERIVVEVIVGGRSQRAALEHDAIWRKLTTSGVRVLDMIDPGAAADAGEALVCGADPEHPGASARVASVWAGASLALNGEVRDLQSVASPDPSERFDVAGLDDSELLDGVGGGGPLEHGPAQRVPRPRRPPAGAVRGVLLGVVGDDVTAARILPWGPRAHAVRGDALQLSQLLFRDLDAALATRGTALGGGFLSGGDRFGAGEPGEAAARAMAALGVHAVFALSYAPSMRHHLVLHGVLPLLWRDYDTREAVRVGDELELTGLSEALVPGGRLTARDLTRGLSLGLHHDLDPHTLSLARAGGLLGIRARGALDPEEPGVLQ
ncbi:MAG: aconitase family protein, partial [Candidatus Eisenbacteria bacterium]